jgi:hypothetical protein
MPRAMNAAQPSPSTSPKWDAPWTFGIDDLDALAVMRD